MSSLKVPFPRYSPHPLARSTEMCVVFDFASCRQSQGAMFTYRVYNHLNDFKKIISICMIRVVIVKYLPYLWHLVLKIGKHNRHYYQCWCCCNFSGWCCCCCWFCMLRFLFSFFTLNIATLYGFVGCVLDIKSNAFSSHDTMILWITVSQHCHFALVHTYSCLTMNQKHTRPCENILT